MAPRILSLRGPARPQPTNGTARAGCMQQRLSKACDDRKRHFTLTGPTDGTQLRNPQARMRDPHPCVHARRHRRGRSRPCTGAGKYLVADVVLVTLPPHAARAERVARLGGLNAFMNWPFPILRPRGFQVVARALAQARRERLPSSRTSTLAHVLTPNGRRDQACSAPTSDASRRVCAALLRRPRLEVDALSLAGRALAASPSRQPGGRFAYRHVGAFGACASKRPRTRRTRSEGYAIEGLAVGSRICHAAADRATGPICPRQARYLMGAARRTDTSGGVRRASNVRCVMPTRAGRHGPASTRHGRLNLKNARSRRSVPLDAASKAVRANTYSKA